MKQIINIAKNELYSLFYSPIAWVIMILFLVLTSIDYSIYITSYLSAIDRGGVFLSAVRQLTNGVLKGEFRGIYTNLYLFFPLITMGLISRETNKGTIKLLYSSPVKVHEIVLGKFLAIVVFTIALIVLVLFTFVGLSISLANPDYGNMIASLIGLFLVLCTFASIGLFISSLTSYSIVAAVITFVVFAVFTKMNMILYNVNILPDITFYLNMKLRMKPLFEGLLNTRDIFYFLIICGSFLSFTIIKLKSATESISIYKKASRYATVIGVAFIIGYISTRPPLMVFIDSTRDQIHTITPPTQKTLAKLDEDNLQITVFANVLTRKITSITPRRQNGIIYSILGPYIRFKPYMEVEFIYYYAESPYAYTAPEDEDKTLKERAQKAAKINGIDFDQVLTLEQVKEFYDVTRENNDNFFLLKYKDKQIVVRTFIGGDYWPYENEWAAAFKRLINQSPTIVFLAGHGERSPFSGRKISYSMLTGAKKNRNSLLNQGYTIDTLSLKNHESIPLDIAGLAIVDPKIHYSQEGINKIKEYITAGGNLFVAAEPYHREEISPVLKLLGLSLHKGILVQSNSNRPANVVTTYLTETAQHLNPRFYKGMQLATKYYGGTGYKVMMKSATALEYNEDGDFKIKPLLKTHELLSWMRFKPVPRDSLHEKLKRPGNSPTGPFITALMMHRKINGKQQVVIAAGDADYIANTLASSRSLYNFGFGFYSFSQFSYGKFPANTMSTDTDNKFAIGSDDVIYQKAAFIYIIPFLMALLGSVILIRRKRK